jgi:hypothetical protein
LAKFQPNVFSSSKSCQPPKKIFGFDKGFAIKKLCQFKRSDPVFRHQGGGDQQQGSANNKAQQAKSVKGGIKALIDEAEERLRARNQQRQQQGIVALFSHPGPCRYK